MGITKHNWTKEEIIAIYNKPLMDLMYEAATIHREQHDPNVVQVSTLLSIKTGFLIASLIAFSVISLNKILFVETQYVLDYRNDSNYYPAPLIIV